MKRMFRIIALLMTALIAVTSCQAPDSGSQLTDGTVDVSFAGPSARTITTDDGLVQTVATSDLWFQYKAEWQGEDPVPFTAKPEWTSLPGPGLASTVKLHRGTWDLSLRAFVDKNDVGEDDKFILSGTLPGVAIGANNLVTQTVSISLGYVRQEGNGTLHISATYPVVYHEAANSGDSPVEAVRKVKVTANVADTDYTGEITTFNGENVGTLDLTVPAGAAHVTVQYYMNDSTLFEDDQTAKDVLIMSTMTTNLAVSVDRDITAVTFKAEQPAGTVEDNLIKATSLFDIYPDEIAGNDIVIGYAEQTKALGDQTPITYPYISDLTVSKDDKGRYKASELGLVPIIVTTDADLRASGATAAWWGKTAVGGDVNREEPNTTLASVRFVDGVTEIKDYAFAGFVALTSVEIPVTVTSIGTYAFLACEGLTSVTIPVNVTSIGDFAFMSCINLANVTIPEGVTTIGNCAFAQCSALTGISIPNSVTSIGGQAFAACPGLTSVTIPVSVTVIGGGAFYGCSLTSLNYSGDLEQWNLVVYVDDVDVICQDGNAVYKTAKIRDGDGESLYVAGLTPYGRNNCTELIIPNCFTLIGGSAFKDCTGLISVTIPDSVTKIVGLAFEGCTNLTSITIPNSVTEIEHHAFYKCSGLTNITIPSSVTKIGDYAFDDCSNLTQINVGDENNSYASVDGVLFSKDMKTLIVCPDGKAGDYSIPSGVTSIKGYAFEDCKALTSVNVPSSVTKIGEYAFAYCDNIVNITLPDVLNTLEPRAFYGCHSLANITIPEGILTVGDRMFSYCQGLIWVSIPSTVTSISKNVFDNCTGLTNIYVAQAEGSALFVNVNIPSGCEIHWNSTRPASV